MSPRPRSHVYCHWTRPGTAKRFRTAVSLHSHTLHSQESLEFIPRYGGRLPLLRMGIRRAELRYERVHGVPLDYSRAWWTPPLCPVAALRTERAQIEDRLDLHPLVSLTDHDSLEAPRELEAAGRPAPYSFEWTVPVGPARFHLGVHNLPADRAGAMFAGLTAYTRRPDIRRLKPLLAMLHECPGTLVVWNHPLWNEEQIGNALYRRHVDWFGGSYAAYLHALEWNGLRPGHENRAVWEMAARMSLPVVSGGDRHGREPNAVVNLTGAGAFSEFAEEVRQGRSQLLLMAQYRESRAVRMIRTVRDVLAEDPAHSRGWTRWSDRVFYRTEDGRVRSLSELWSRQPGLVRLLAGLVRLTGHPGLRTALRFATSGRGEN